MVVRFRKDTDNGRILVAEKICPVSGPDRLTKAEQRRRADEIIAAAGVNNTSQIRRTVLSGTFAYHAERFMIEPMNRSGDTISPTTKDGWQCCLDSWLVPKLGDMLLQDIDSATLRDLVVEMRKANLSAQSIKTYVGLAKRVIASVVDDRGNYVFKPNWNHRFIGVPRIRNQKRPAVTGDHVTEALARTEGQDRMLLMLPAATGLRFSELLGLRIADVKDGGTTLELTQQAYHSEILDRLKTDNAARLVDVHPDIAKELLAFIGKRTTGLLFCTSKGKPISQSNIRNRLLYPILEEVGAPKAGMHAFRRFRTTHLRENGNPERLTKYWLGHSAEEDTTDKYDLSIKNASYRKAKAAQIGYGFALNVLSVLRPSERGVVVAA